MTDEKVLIDFADEDFIITVSPLLDDNLRWTGELAVSLTMADSNYLHEDDYNNVLHFCNLLCAAIPLMEEESSFRNLLQKRHTKELKEIENDTRILTKEGNVITLSFNSKTEGSA